MIGINRKRALRRAGCVEAGASINWLVRKLPYRPPAISSRNRPELRPFYMIADFCCATRQDRLYELEQRQCFTYENDEVYGPSWSGSPRVAPFDANARVYMRDVDGVPMTREDVCAGHQLGQLGVLWEGVFLPTSSAEQALRICEQSHGLYFPLVESISYDDDPDRPDDNIAWGTCDFGDDRGLWSIAMHVRAAQDNYLVLDVIGESMTIKRSPYTSVKKLLAAYA